MSDSPSDLALLLAESEASGQGSIGAMLESQAGIVPTVVGDGEQAWAMLSAGTFDVLLADVQLPGMDGETLCRRMKAHRRLRLVPTILMTTRDDEDALVSALEAGADEFLSKPITSTRLLARLSGARRLRRLLVELDAKNKELAASIDRLRESQQELLHAQKMESIGQLASGIAHELNTPIQFIGDNLRFLQEGFGGLQQLLATESGVYKALLRGGDPRPLISQVERVAEDCDLEFLREEIPAAIAQGLDGVERVRKIVVAMRDFAHPGNEEREPIDLNQAIESTIVVARNTYKYVADLQLDLDEELPLLVGDAGGIKQVVLNLIVNAAHAIEDRHEAGDDRRGTILVRSHRSGSEVVLEVRDDGCGMSEAVQQRIFDPFFTTKEPGRGTGQGLAIIHNVVVKQHRGRIDVDSEPGVGTTMRINWPLEP